jgi:hypothetical protein
MKHSEFVLGIEFLCCEGQWRCTDIGRRTIVAIRIDRVECDRYDAGTSEHLVLNRAEAEAKGLFNGPPYAVQEQVFDEYDLEDCALEKEPRE